MLIATERLVLRRFRDSDAATLTAYRRDPDVARYQSWDTTFTAEQGRSLAAALSRGEPDRPGWFQYAIEHDRVHIGDVGVNLHDNLMQAGLGYTLATAYQGRGLATEALTGILDHLFRRRGLHRVSAELDARNVASERLLQRLGFTQEGHLRSHSWVKGEWTDDLIYGILRSEWAQPS